MGRCGGTVPTGTVTGAAGLTVVLGPRPGGRTFERTPAAAEG
jgi:hypothetical protein